MTPPDSFAVVIPCFNAAPYLGALLDSVFAQTVPVDQVLLCDDCSQDDSIAVAQRFERVTILAGQKRQGPSAARNRGWQAATTTWVHFHDADDLMEPRFLELTLARAKATGADVVLADGQDFQHGGPVGTGPVFSYAFLDGPDVLRACLEHVVGGTFGLYRRTALEKVGGFAQDLLGGEDPDLHVRLAAAGIRFAHVPQVLVHRRIHGDNYSLRHPEEGYRGTVRAARRYFQVLPPETHALVAEGCARVARELDRMGANTDADEAWRVLSAAHHEVFPTSNAAVKAAAKVLPPGVLSAILSHHPRLAARRGLRRLMEKVSG